MHCFKACRKDKKHFISLILLFLFTLSIFPCVFAQNEEDHSYSIPYANIDLYVEENGNLHVVEKIHYSFTGTYHGVYRDIPIADGQNIENLKISANGAYSSYEVNKTGNMESIKIFLYSDPQKTTPIADKDLDVFIEYDFSNVIKIYNDVAELHYKLWGEGWAVNVGQINGNVHLKSNNGVQYWLNPPYFVKNANWQNGTLQIETEKVPSGKYFEVRMAIPKDQFVADPPLAEKIDINGLPEIEKIQKDYENSLNFKTNLYPILAILMLLSIFLPVLIYFRFGREPKIEYNAEYERDLPTDDLPAVVNAISGKGLGKKVGEPDMDGFRATIMDLINRKYLLIQDIPSKLDGDKGGSLSLKIDDNKNHNKLKNFESNVIEFIGLQDIPSRLDEDKGGSLSLKINNDKNLAELKNFESDVINFLSYFEEDGIIRLDRIKQDLKDQNTAKSFKKSFNLWKDDLKNEFLDDGAMNKIFLKKGDTYLKIFGIIGLVAAVVTFYFTISDPLPAASYALIASLILGIVAVISLIMPQKVAGQWTTYGEEYDAKWHNFRKYIQDFSLIKEYPPESIIVWNKYLVYATALGVADKVKKTMEMTLPSDELARSDIYMFHYYGGYVILSSSLDAGMSTATSGGPGGAGGGSGGGGGGAF